MVTKELVKKFPGLKEPVQQLENEAREEGMFLAFQKSFFDLLDDRLGSLDKKILPAINSIHDLKTLQFLFKKAVHLKSPEALRNAIITQAAANKNNGHHNGRHKAVRSK